MHLIVRNIRVPVLGGLILASLIILSFSMIGSHKTIQGTKLTNDPFQGMSLTAPPAYAIGSVSATPPLDTSRISLIAYYQKIDGWTLGDTAPAFISHFDGGNYYDGLVRVWDSGTIGASSHLSWDQYIDVQVRVRSDGWILAWFDRILDDPGSIVYWGHAKNYIGAPPYYSTTLSRAIEIVYTVATVSFPGYSLMGMYDYSESNASRLLIFGHSIHQQTVEYYYSFPANSTLMPLKMLIRTAGLNSISSWGELDVDGGVVFKTGYGEDWGWMTYQIVAFDKGIQHSVTQFAGLVNHVAFIMWIE
jgi:hypothetical protein